MKEQPGLNRAHEPAEQVEADREPESPPFTPIEALQGAIEILGRGECFEFLEPPQQAGSATHESGDLDGQKAARADQLDEQEPEHRPHEPRVDRQPHRCHDANEQEERLRERDGGLGDDHRGDALAVGHVGAEKPHLDRIAAHRGQRRHDVYGLARDAGDYQAEKWHTVVGEGVSPAQSVDGHDQPERQADEERSPAEPASRLDEGLVAPYSTDEDDHDRESDQGGEPAKDAHGCVKQQPRCQCPACQN